MKSFAYLSYYLSKSYITLDISLNNVIPRHNKLLSLPTLEN